MPRSRPLQTTVFLRLALALAVSGGGGCLSSSTRYHRGAGTLLPAWRKQHRHQPAHASDGVVVAQGGELQVERLHVADAACGPAGLATFAGVRS